MSEHYRTVAVIGGGASGIMAALTAASSGMISSSLSGVSFRPKSPLPMLIQPFSQRCLIDQRILSESTSRSFSAIVAAIVRNISLMHYRLLNLSSRRKSGVRFLRILNNLAIGISVIVIADVLFM